MPRLKRHAKRRRGELTREQRIELWLGPRTDLDEFDPKTPERDRSHFASEADRREAWLAHEEELRKRFPGFRWYYDPDRGKGGRIR
jgi:hypothetical protein